jgi:peptide deformylase
VLRKKAKPVKEISNEIVKLVIDMFETMRNAEGIGLAANQVGRLDKVIVVDLSAMEEYKEMKPLALLNPQIIEIDGSSVVEEGCLSIPEVRDEVERPDRIKVRFMDMNGDMQEIEAGGLPARVIQHEIDHVNGILFLSHLDKAHRKTHKEQLSAIKHGEVETKYEVVSAAEEETVS